MLVVSALLVSGVRPRSFPELDPFSRLQIRRGPGPKPGQGKVNKTLRYRAVSGPGRGQGMGLGARVVRRPGGRVANTRYHSSD